jgi:hypothetical protein
MTVNNEKWGLGNINMLLGGILILIGVLFLMGQVFGINLGRFVWPFFVIVPGVLLFIFALAARGSAGEGLAVLGSIVTMLGTLLLYQNTTGHWESWAYAWALVAPTSIGLGQIVYGSLRSQQHVVATGKRLATVGIAIFLVGAVFFELIIGISGFGFGRFLLPVLLIGLGGLFLVRSLLFD